MDFSNSLFLFEIVVEELNSFVDCKEFYITSKFADVFTLNLKDPNELDTLLPKVKKIKKKTRLREKTVARKLSTEAKVQTGQSILFTSKLDTLINKIKNFPIELSLYSKDNCDEQLGSAHILWSPVYVDYLYRLFLNPETSPVHSSGGYNIYDDFTSKRMATLRLNIKLTYLKDKLSSSFCSLSQDNERTFMCAGFNSKPTTILSTVKEEHINLSEETGIIKTIYDGKSKIKSSKSKASRKKVKETMEMKEDIIETLFNKQAKEQTLLENPAENRIEEIGNSVEKFKIPSSRLSLVRSDTDLDKTKQIEVIKTKSCSSLSREQFSILNYIFGDSNRVPLGNQVYCVGYVTVENEFKENQDQSSSSKEGSIKDQSDSEKSETANSRCKFRICDKDCPSRIADDTCNSVCSLDLPADANLLGVTKCTEVECEHRKYREVPPRPDESIRLDVSNLNKECCTVKNVVGGMQAKMKFDENACFCSCECTFGFVQKTKYCEICGGYEKVGEDMSTKLPSSPFPCPIYHKLIDKNKLKTWSTSGSDSKKNGIGKKMEMGNKSLASARTDKDAESDKDSSKKGKTKKKDDRFKFNYGYTAPQIGHSNCVMPCTGTLGPVPKNMGWLWTAEDIPGIKFRPLWKPGATNKHVVRLLRLAKYPDAAFAKKKRKDAGKQKRPLKRPLLVVQKKEGEYTVTMETMRSFPKQRAPNQYPYEEKPVVTYTIGRTDEENCERRKKKERAQRRLERSQREFIQSAFKDMCQEICLKTYQQALGILPDAEDPDCACYPKHPGADETNLDLSCSCSEDKNSIGSDTESDEWVVEFTPPNATFDPTYKGKKIVKTDNATQYTYLDYRVKLLDRYGNPVPRFFKGPDGKQQCSDLGGFWSPDHKWLEINVEGYIAPDGRWVPMAFIGPSGEQVDCDTGKFQATNGNWLVVGVDGYVDCTGKWKSYHKPKVVASPSKKHRVESGKKGAGDRKDDKAPYKKSETTWSCFGDAKPKDLSKMGILGHGHDKKLLLATLKEMLDRGEDVKIPQQPIVPHVPASKKGKRKYGMPTGPEAYNSKTYFFERQKCKHSVPSDKGIVAVDGLGNKTYFRLKDYKNKRPKDRLTFLTDQGISLSSFHVPCFHSFINTEIMKKQQYDRLVAMSQYGIIGAKSEKSKCVSTQV